MPTKDEAIAAAKTLVEWCKGENPGYCRTCPFDAYPFCKVHTPMNWNMKEKKDEPK
jgi:hypothetical protein